MVVLDKLEKGKSFLYNLIKNSVIKAVLTGYAEDGLPLLTLFITNELYQVSLQLFSKSPVKMI